MKTLRQVMAGAAIALLLAGCALFNATTKAIQTGQLQPLDPAQVAQDQATAAWFLKATGCNLDAAAGVAAPAVQVFADTQGNRVLQAVDASGKVACQMTVPANALPAPASTPSTPA